MRDKLLLAAIILLVFAGSFLAKGLLSKPRSDRPPETRRCERIVSMSPDVTETLFELGLGDRVVGVTRYCKYPPEARTKAKVGGFLDPNFEALLALKPDLVVIRDDNQQSRAALRRLRLNTLAVSHKSVEGILDSITTIGRALGEEARAEEIVSDVHSRIGRIERKTAGRDRPRVLFVVARPAGSGKLEGVTVAAADGFFDKLITLAGGQNACRDVAAPFPLISSEGILWMKPQVIIDLVRPISETKLDKETILRDWQQVAAVEAVKNRRVYVVDDDFASIPGPRFILLVEKLARLIHPEIDWQ